MNASQLALTIPPAFALGTAFGTWLMTVNGRLNRLIAVGRRTVLVDNAAYESIDSEPQAVEL